MMLSSVPSYALFGNSRKNIGVQQSLLIKRSYFEAMEWVRNFRRLCTARQHFQMKLANNNF